MTVSAPTNIRHRIIGVTMLMAFILYLDRICMGEIVKSASFHHDLGLSKEQIGRILGAFFFAYALLQVPAGWACDRFRLRWGRLLPMTSSMFVCAASYLCCPFVGSTWLLVACCAVVSFCTDLANPALWAFMGDVGGRATAAAGGWANMWGNFGAGAGALLVPWLMKIGGGDGKTLVFFTLAGAFMLAGLLVLPMDATRKLIPDESPQPHPAAA